MARILVAANNAEDRGLLALVIEFGGHLCKMAGSLQESVGLLRNHSFDLVIAGFKLDGARLDKIVKSIKNASPKVPVMILFESSDATEVPDEVLVTVASPEALFQHIERALGRKFSVRKMPARSAKLKAVPVKRKIHRSL